MKNFFKKTIIHIITLQARFVLWRRKPKIIAVTGSVGKTTAKDAIFTALQSSVTIRKNEKSFNSEIGVPLTILGLPTAWGNPFAWAVTIVRGFLVMFSLKKYPKWLVLEAGIDRPFDMENLVKWLKVDVAVFTIFPTTPVHVEYFSSPEAVWDEKIKLADGLKRDGIIIANGDDENVMKKVRLYKKRMFTFGCSATADVDVRALPYEYVYENDAVSGITFKIEHNNNTLPVNMMGVIGKQHVYPALAAITAGVAIGLNPVTLVDALRTHVAPRGRMNVFPGINGSTIIDDTYNSSPIALEVALDTLADVKVEKNNGRKIAIIGDMLELGSVSPASHETAGKHVAKEKFDVLVTVGVRAKGIAEAAIADGMSPDAVFSYPDSKDQEMQSDIKDMIQKGDVVLVKGSQGSRMERISKVLLSPEIDPLTALVRQESVWDVR